MRILIAGCGYLGTALGARFAGEGHRVFGLRRHPSGFPEGLEPLSADLSAPESLRSLPDRLDRVFYTAGAQRRDEASYQRAYVEGLGNLLVALAATGSRPQRVFFTSSTAVYGQHAGEWVDESSATDPGTFTGKQLLEGEDCLAGGPFPATTVRLGGIYGPGRIRLIDRVRAGEARYQAGLYTNRIHREDCVGLLYHLAGLPDPAPLYIGVDCEPAPQEELLRWLAAQLAAPAPQPAEAGDAPGRSSKRCRNARLLATGYRFRYPTFREGYAALLEGRQAP